MGGHFDRLESLSEQISGFSYPNEIELHWGLLVVLYPYITGLVAGAFILASLEKVFKVTGHARKEKRMRDPLDLVLPIGEYQLGNRQRPPPPRRRIFPRR